MKKTKKYTSIKVDLPKEVLGIFKKAAKFCKISTSKAILLVTAIHLAKEGYLK